jgi:tetratricopeptide (TPR) repeat protein
MNAAREIRDEVQAADGRLVLSVRALRNRFGHDRLTAATRQEIGAALAQEGICVAPSLADARLDDTLELTVVRSQHWWRRSLRGGIKVWHLLLGAVSLAATLTGLYTFGEEHLARPPGPTRLIGDLKVLVADLEERADDGTIRVSQQGHDQALLLQRSLDRQLAPAEPRGGAREPLIIEVGDASSVAPLNGDDQRERAAAAGELAEARGADLIVSGLLSETETATVVMPEFYVSQAKLSSAPELAGQYRFGAPIRIQGRLEESAEASRRLREAYAGRTSALAAFLVGLGEFTHQAYGRAARKLRAAAESPAWLDTGGREVIYLFLGNAELRAGKLDRASQAFGAALEIVPGFARARFGLAEISFQRACRGGRPDQQGVLDAISEYERVLDAPLQPDTFPMRVKTNLTLGRAHLCLEPPRCDRAKPYFDAVIADYRSGRSKLRDETAEAWGGSGIWTELCRREELRDPDVREEAQQMYRTAARLSALPERQAFWFSLLAELLARGGEPEEAERAYEQAIAAEPSARIRSEYERSLRRIRRLGEQ